MKDSRKSVIKIWVQRPKPKGNNRLEKRKEMSWSPHVFTKKQISNFTILSTNHNELFFFKKDWSKNS